MMFCVSELRHLQFWPSLSISVLSVSPLRVVEMAGVYPGMGWILRSVAFVTLQSSLHRANGNLP